MADAELDYVGHAFINFEDRSFRWVDVKHFRLPEGVTEQEALALLVAHVRYRDHYASRDSHEQPTENVHGPYWLDRITLDGFEPVDAETAVRTVTDFATEFDDGEPAIAADIVARLDREVYARIRAMPIRYRLKDLGEDAIHEWGAVLINFRELVLLDPSTGQLDLLVAAID